MKLLLKKNRFDFITGNTWDWVICIIMLLPFLVISMYNHPVGDDYWCTTLVRKVGYWNAQIQLYDVVPPRYTELALSCLTPLSFGNFWGYKIIPAAFILLFILIISRLFKTLSANGLSRNDRLLMACLFTAIYLSVLPGIGEGIYWASALSVYHTGIVLFIILINALFNWYCRQKRNWRVFAVACLCVVGIVGCNEIIAIISAAVIVWMGIYQLLNKRKLDALLISMALILGGCLFFTLTFKGIGNRQQLLHTDASGRIFYAAGIAVMGAGYYIARCLLNPFFWVGIIAMRGIFIKFSGHFFNSCRQLFEMPKYFLSLWLFSLFIVFFPVLMLTGNKPPLRISNMSVFLFLFGLIYWVTFVANNKAINNRLAGFMGVVNKYRYVLQCLLLLTGFALKGNVPVAVSEIISGKAYYYDREMNERYKLLQECVTDTCVVPPLKHIPVTLRYGSADYDPHIAEYFNKKAVIKSAK